MCFSCFLLGHNAHVKFPPKQFFFNFLCYLSPSHRTPSIRCLFICSVHQSVNLGGDQELENLVTKLAILKDLLSSIEKKVHAQNLTFACTISLCCSLSETFFFYLSVFPAQSYRHSNTQQPDNPYSSMERLLVQGPGIFVSDTKTYNLSRRTILFEKTKRG